MFIQVQIMTLGPCVHLQWGEIISYITSIFTFKLIPLEFLLASGLYEPHGWRSVNINEH